MDFIALIYIIVKIKLIFQHFRSPVIILIFAITKIFFRILIILRPVQIHKKTLAAAENLKEDHITNFFLKTILKHSTAKLNNYRKKLIEGSRGILQGTSSLLLCFDESEVRKIIRECKRVLDYLAVTEVIETMEDLVHFLKNLSPCLSKVSREVSAREKELTHQVHRETLVRCLDQVSVISISNRRIFVAPKLTQRRLKYMMV